jgi:hypothetical protein
LVVCWVVTVTVSDAVMVDDARVRTTWLLVALPLTAETAADPSVAARPLLTEMLYRVPQLEVHPVKSVPDGATNVMVSLAGSADAVVNGME